MNPDKYDCVCSKSELELFSTPPVNTSMEGGSYQAHYPISSITETSPLEFHVAASPDEYIDLGRTKLYLKFKVVAATGDAIKEDDKIVPINLLSHSLFSQVDVRLNDRLVTPSLNTYAYKAYIETLLSHGVESKSSWLTSSMWYPDDINPEVVDPTAEEASAGMQARYARIKESKSVETISRPHVDIFQQDKMLLNGVHLTAKFIRAPPAFTLLGPDVSKFKIVIQDAKLLIRRVRVNPSISMEHAKTLEQNIPAKYPLRRGTVTSFTVPTGSKTFVKENLIQGQLPRRLFAVMVPNAGFNGSGGQNPFNFLHFTCNYLQVSIGSQSYPSQPYTPDFATDLYAEMYNDLLQATGHLNSSTGFGVSYEQFKHGGCIMAGFDFTSDQSEGEHIDPIKYGTMRMEGHFKTELPQTINVVYYAEYDNLLTIDRSRSCVTDFGST